MTRSVSECLLRLRRYGTMISEEILYAICLLLSLIAFFLMLRGGR